MFVFGSAEGIFEVESVFAESLRADLSQVWGLCYQGLKLWRLSFSGLDIDAALKGWLAFTKFMFFLLGACKECCFLAKKGWGGEAKIVCTNYGAGHESLFDFSRTEKSLEGTYGEFQKYLYEPNPSIMKGGV